MYLPSTIHAAGRYRGHRCPCLASSDHRPSKPQISLPILWITLSIISSLSIEYSTSAAIDGTCLRKSSLPKPAPKRFSDAHLPVEPSLDSEEIEHLGRIARLNTFMGPRTDVVVASFNLYNRRKTMKRVTFQPNTYSSLLTFNEKVGPYEFNLDHLIQSSFKASSKTVIMIPGYMSDEDEPWITKARKIWLDLEDVNVIEVSWTHSNKCIYSQAVARTPIVARQIVILLHYLAELSETSLKDKDFLMNIHLIGHSLGAHISGFVGRDLGGLVGRITGLDPAGPSFDLFDRRDRLNKNFAQLVEVIHTNAGKMHYANAAAGGMAKILSKVGVLNALGQAICASYSGEGDTAWYGIDLNLGHIDYYANNGHVQPGCNDIFRICDHGRATDIYVEIMQSERLFRTWTRDEKLLKKRRLLAFPAKDYNDFMRGTNFQDQCPIMLDIEKHLDSEIESQFKRCSAPIDLIKPTTELIEELKTDYNIDFSGTEVSRQKYYFNTLDTDETLLGDQYMLKIYCDYVYFDEACSFDIGLLFPGEFKLKRLDLNGISGIRNYSNHTFAIPFVYSGGDEARELLAATLSELEDNPGATISGIRLRHLLPANVTISLKKSKTKTIFRTVTSGLSNLIGMATRPACETSISAIEIHPLYGYGRNFAGIYKHEYSKKDFVLVGSSALAEYLTDQFDNEQEHLGILKPKSETKHYTNAILRGFAFG